MAAIEIIKTSDGSDSLLNTTLNETYHSIHGAIQESQHVFIKAGLDFVIRRSTFHSINILEVGFGTGLNALLTLKHVTGLQNQIHYTTLEAFPLQGDTWPVLNYGQKLDAEEHYKKLHTCPWENWNKVTSNFNFRKIHNTLQNVKLSDHYDLIYFDAFAPNKQPEMWEYPMLKKIIDNMNGEGVFVTYCAKGQLKRDLKALNFDVETLEGPPGKKEMVRALKNR